MSVCRRGAEQVSNGASSSSASLACIPSAKKTRGLLLRAVILDSDERNLQKKPKKNETTHLKPALSHCEARSKLAVLLKVCLFSPQASMLRSDTLLMYKQLFALSHFTVVWGNFVLTQLICINKRLVGEGAAKRCVLHNNQTGECSFAPQGGAGRCTKSGSQRLLTPCSFLSL